MKINLKIHMSCFVLIKIERISSKTYKVKIPQYRSKKTYILHTRDKEFYKTSNLRTSDFENYLGLDRVFIKSKLFNNKNSSYKSKK